MAYLFDLCFCGIKLTDGEENEENFGAYFLLKFLGKTDSFQESLFEIKLVPIIGGKM